MKNQNKNFSYSIGCISHPDGHVIRCAKKPLADSRYISELFGIDLMAIYEVSFSEPKMYKRKGIGDVYIVAGKNCVTMYVDRGTEVKLLAQCSGLEFNGDTMILPMPEKHDYQAVCTEDRLRNIIRFAYQTAQVYRERIFDPYRKAWQEYLFKKSQQKQKVN